MTDVLSGISVGASALTWLAEVEQQRKQAGLRRSLRPRPAVTTELAAASTACLGLSQHPDVIEGGVAALRMWGAGATGSRLVTGDTELHQDFEAELADFVGAASGLLFSSGYTANLGAVVGLSGPGSLLVSDALSHASLVDACRLSRARVQVTPHRDVTAVVRAHLIDAARPFIFDTGLAPAAVGAARAALHVLQAERWRPDAVLRHARFLAETCDVPEEPQSAVVSVILGDPEVALAAATACLDAGVKVGCFRPPTVPAGTSRLRLTARASLDAAELEIARRVLTDVLSATRP